MYIRISSVYRVTVGKSVKVFLSFTREPRAQPTFSVNIPRKTQYYYSVSQSNERASAFNAVSENCSMRMPTIGTLKFRIGTLGLQSDECSLIMPEKPQMTQFR